MDWFDSFDDRSLARGMDYARKGYARNLIGDPHKRLLAEVSNGRGDFYTQEIEISPRGGVEGMCSCPVGYNCKHVAAALFTWFRDQASKPPKQPANQSQVSREVQLWLARAAEVAEPPKPEERPEDYPAKVKERLLYLLETPQGAVKISVWKGRINAKGTALNKTMQRYNVLQNLRNTVAKFIRPVDLDLLSQLAEAKLINDHYSYYGGSSVPDALQRAPSFGADLIKQLCETERLFWENNTETRLSWSQERAVPDLKWETQSNGRQRLGFAHGEIVQIGAEQIWIDRNRGLVGALEGTVSPEVMQLVAQSPELSPQDLNAVSTALPTRLGSLPLPKPARIKETTRKAKTKTAKLTLDVAKTSGRSWYREPTYTLPVMTLRFDYEGQEVELYEHGSPRLVRDGEITTLRRDRKWEEACFARIEASGAIEPYEGDFMPSEKMLDADLVFPDEESREAMLFTFQTLPKLKAEGWQIDQSPKWPFKLTEAEADFSISTNAESGEGFAGHDWFSLGFQARIGDHTLDMAPMIAAFMEQLAGRYDLTALPSPEELAQDLTNIPAYVEIKPGQYAEISLAPIAPVLHLFLRRQAELEQMHPTDASLAREVQEALAGSDVPFSDNAGILPLAEAFRSLSEERAFEPPEGLTAELRPYQSFGADWMSRLTDAGFGGVLADDMGLGKTVQGLTTVLARKGRGPSLLIAPTSLLHSWASQAAQFTPDLQLLTFQGLKRRELIEDIPKADLVLTTYPLLARDKDILKAQNWDLIILDEAQTLKNPASQMAKSLRELPCTGRLALTGTPLENSLQDLWTLFDWVVPGLLGNRKTFVSLFRTPIEKHGDAQAQERLNRRVKPFLLRRTKEEVASELPPRTEILEQIELPKAQQALYETVRAAMDERVRDAVHARGFNGAQITILDALLKLRQVCCDPKLVKSDAARSVTDSAKRARLRELLTELIAEGRRVLVFSQFTTMLDLIAEDLTEMGHRFVTLTGQTKDRAAVLEAFQNGEADVFLLSLKAGGVGLTLTEADTVILYDPWWNPAVERQAMDRAHRIGQTKPVFVHRLVATGTVEEKILGLQAKKQALADALLSESHDASEPLFDEKTLADLFKPLG